MTEGQRVTDCRPREEKGERVMTTKKIKVFVGSSEGNGIDERSKEKRHMVVKNEGFY